MKALFVPAVLLGLLSFVLVRRAYTRCSILGARASIAAVALVLAVPAVLITSNYLLLLPYARWFQEMRALPCAEVSSGLVGAILGVLFASSRLRPGRLNLPVLVVCTLVAASLLLAPFARQLLYGIDYSTLEHKWDNGVCLQTSGHTCVPACAATLIRIDGGRVTEPELAQAAGTTRTGTETWYLTRALRARGYEPHYRHLRSVRQAPVPSIVGVRVGSIHHVVVLLDKDRRGITIGEPLRGRRTYTWEQFMRFYRPGGLCIVVRRARAACR